MPRLTNSLLDAEPAQRKDEQTMIITRTPFRVSFLGGGTDYPAWYQEHGGAVLAATIDKYCYLTCRYLPPFFDHRFRIVYSKIENVRTLDEITHAAAREILRFLGVQRGMEIHYLGDLPARSGIGSSSAFTVGLLHAVHALHGRSGERARNWPWKRSTWSRTSSRRPLAPRTR